MEEETKQVVETVVKTETKTETSWFKRIVGFPKSVMTKANGWMTSIQGAVGNDQAADGIMRWPRPVAFFMLVIMFTVGWFHPATLLLFAQALAAFPESFWTVVFIILGSIGVSKGANDIVKIIGARKP